MPNNFLPDKFVSLLKLARFHSPTGYLLSFFPASFGLLLAYEETSNLIYLPLFFVGSILARSAGCVINDLIDRDLDKKVVRTKDRPIASGAIAVMEALIFLAILLSACLAILLSLTKTSIIVGLIAFFLILLYPLMKRITYFPQVFLGITFNTGCLIGYAAIKDDISLNAVLMYMACGFWTIGYDTIYGFMDIKDDKKIGIKSTAIFFEHSNVKLVIAALYLLFLGFFMLATRDFLSIYYFFIMLISIVIIVWMVISLDINDPKNCLVWFKSNNYLGFLLFLLMLLEKL